MSYYSQKKRHTKLTHINVSCALETHIPIYARTCMGRIMDDAWTMHGSSISGAPSSPRDSVIATLPAACMAHAQLAPSIFCWVWTARFPDFYSASRMRERGGERKTLRKYNIRGRGSCHMLQISRRTTNGCTCTCRWQQYFVHRQSLDQTGCYCYRASIV